MTKRYHLIEVEESFYITIMLISPVEKILNQLNNKEFRDCDIRWLEDKLDLYCKIALKTFNCYLEIENLRFDENYGIMNSYTRERYIKHFSTILNYFKTLI